MTEYRSVKRRLHSAVNRSNARGERQGLSTFLYKRIGTGKNCYSSNGQPYCSVHSMLAWKRLFSLLGGAETHSRRARRVLLLITRDVRNAFNSVRRKDILGTLDNTFYVPIYFLRILRDYLRNHSLLYETLEGQRRIKVTVGLAQGSILGSDLWNASYDSLLKLGMPEEWRLVDYANDVAAFVVGCKADSAY